MINSNVNLSWKEALNIAVGVISGNNDSKSVITWNSKHASIGHLDSKNGIGAIARDGQVVELIFVVIYVGNRKHWSLIDGDWDHIDKSSRK